MLGLNSLMTTAVDMLLSSCSQRDIDIVHKVGKQINRAHNTPYSQWPDLGWVIVEEMCLGTVHKPSEVNVYTANIMH